MSQAPLLIVADRITPRMRYACLLAFETLLGLPFELSTANASQQPCLHYTAAPPSGDSPWLQASGWLDEETPPAKGWSPPKALQTGQFFPATSPQSLLPYDALASLAWLGMLGPLLHPGEGELDAHGRSSFCLPQPVAHHMAGELADALKLSLPQRPSTWELTLDVDQPWLHAHKGFVVKWAGLFKDFFLLRWGSVATRLRAMWGNDPYDVYPLIAQKCPPSKTTLFFLLDGSHPLDSRFTASNPSLAQLIQDLSRKKGYTVGIHPSYLSSKTPGMGSHQKQLLEGILKSPITSSRQHYLLYHPLHTFAEMEAAGIQREYSLCPLQGTGFVNGFCVPHPWYNPMENRVSNLWLVPSVVMDRGLLNAGLTPREGAQHLAEIRKLVRGVGGHFVPILHNETFSDHGVWKGWTTVFLDLVDSLRTDGV